MNLRHDSEGELLKRAIIGDKDTYNDVKEKIRIKNLQQATIKWGKNNSVLNTNLEKQDSINGGVLKASIISKTT